ncbi:hypothetical protein A3C91_01100 [Candidatus Azambacteria bacterium RIFCSPHIGHO2_02_FULL_52_12]|uniref:Glutamyl-tRNA amidotransferase n=1 Tax=Candidatus Azambacteria bacterium RIFCSPLOWO2_01_FULL_46_25 TaxID=1797298 RepID=A0A1F5BUA6_9BACT|nr:MAG: hypothetical protein A3C91_01100 [Candidatus Azambacteria bacterium RIFCSPHIGHO2_02_FULL_52_12]OGD34168.1 MAG: hypothetical protein A2988_01675 [Candidatus Azambacteria bacterium RIFCSPLOWO2_01_FULL_46_25]OGD37743.1 MAG: hypothetical protein A2850_03355 [Candidatus Azambacteria bacterium RIFCSPHIGHO2_01_FULL_51_74]
MEGNLYRKIEADIKHAFKTGDALRRSVLVMLKSAIANKAIENREKDAAPSDQMVQDLVSIEVKRRRDTMAQYEAAGRADLAEKEKQELAILMDFLPQQLTEEEIASLVDLAVLETKAQGEKDFGKVMGALASKIKGRADGAAVSKIVKAKLLG